MGMLVIGFRCEWLKKEWRRRVSVLKRTQAGLGLPAPMALSGHLITKKGMKKNYFFPKRTKGLASTREEREQLLRTVAATEYTI